MNGVCWASQADRQRLREESENEREAREKAEALNRAEKELFELFEVAFKGGAVLFPHIMGLSDPRKVYGAPLSHAVGDAVADVDSAANKAAVALCQCKPTDDLAALIGAFRDAVANQYISDHANDIANNAMGWDR